MSNMNKQESLSRRGFLGSMGSATAIAAAAAATPAPALAAQKSQYGMVIDTRRCSGCHACSVSCKTEFGLILGGARAWVEYVDSGTFPEGRRDFVPRLCNHCSEPPCVPVCPVDATTKREEDGIVVVDQDKCIGCRSCVMACPYDARYMDPTAGNPAITENGAADKCDFCLHRLAQGVVPACVNTCPGKARIFGNLSDPSSEVSKLLAANQATVLLAGEGTGPNVYYIGVEHSGDRDDSLKARDIILATHRNEELWAGEPTHRRAE